MKTNLVINSELRKYLYKEIRRTSKETEEMGAIKKLLSGRYVACYQISPELPSLAWLRGEIGRY